MSKPGIYTITRSKEDIKNIEAVKKQLDLGKITDSKIYRLLPEIYLNAVKQIKTQDLMIQELQAKTDRLLQLKNYICGIKDMIEGDE